MHVTIIQRLVIFTLLLLMTPQLPASQLLPVLPDGNVPDASNVLKPANRQVAKQDADSQVDLESIKKVLTAEIREGNRKRAGPRDCGDRDRTGRG